MEPTYPIANTPEKETRVLTEFGVLQRKENERLEMMKKNKNTFSWRLVISGIVIGGLLLLFFCIYSVVFSLKQSQDLPNIDVSARVQHPETQILLEETIVEAIDPTHQQSDKVVLEETIVEAIDRKNQPSDKAVLEETNVEAIDRRIQPSEEEMSKKVDNVSTPAVGKIQLEFLNAASADVTPVPSLVETLAADSLPGAAHAEIRSSSTTERSAEEEAPLKTAQANNLSPKEFKSQINSADSRLESGADNQRIKLSAILKRLISRLVPNRSVLAETNRIQSGNVDEAAERSRQAGLTSFPSDDSKPTHRFNLENDDYKTTANDIDNRPDDKTIYSGVNYNDTRALIREKDKARNEYEEENRNEDVWSSSPYRSESIASASNLLYNGEQSTNVVRRDHSIPKDFFSGYSGPYDTSLAYLNRGNDGFDSPYPNGFPSRLRSHYNHFSPNTDGGHLLFYNQYAVPLSGLDPFRSTGSADLRRGVWIESGGRRAKALTLQSRSDHNGIGRHQLPLGSNWPVRVPPTVLRSSASRARGLGSSNDLPYRLPYNLLPATLHPVDQFNHPENERILSD